MITHIHSLDTQKMNPHIHLLKTDELDTNIHIHSLGTHLMNTHDAGVACMYMRVRSDACMHVYMYVCMCVQCACEFVSMYVFI